MAVIIQLRRGSASEWTTHNPTLAPGEMGVELDTGKFKVGDGTTVWDTLPYSSGEDGATWLVESRAPLEGDGVPGDLFLQTDTGDVFWNNEGSWTQVMNIMGPPGADGSSGIDGATWHAGEGSPAGGLGKVGDYYLDTITGDVYWSDGSWTVQASILGPPGPPGEPGTFDPNVQETISFNGHIADKPVLKSYAEKVETHSSASGAVTIAVEDGNVHALHLTGTTTLSFSLPAEPETEAYSFSLCVSGLETHPLQWPTGVLWRNATPPPLDEIPGGAMCLFSFLTLDHGASWLAMDGGVYYVGE